MRNLFVFFGVFCWIYSSCTYNYYYGGGDSLEPDVSDSFEPDVSDSFEPDVSDSLEPDVSDSLEPDVSDSLEPDVSDSFEPDVSDSFEPDVSDSDTLDPDVQPDLTDVFQPPLYSECEGTTLYVVSLVHLDSIEAWDLNGDYFGAIYYMNAISYFKVGDVFCLENENPLLLGENSSYIFNKKSLEIHSIQGDEVIADIDTNVEIQIVGLDGEYNPWGWTIGEISWGPISIPPTEWSVSSTFINTIYIEIPSQLNVIDQELFGIKQGDVIGNYIYFK